MADPISGLIVGLAGRIIPEVVTHFDKRNERKHEQEMFKSQIEADRLRAEQKLEQTHLEGGINLELQGIQALVDANKAQADMAIAAGGGWAGLSASVRPVVTYVLLALYAMYKVLMVCIAAQAQDATLMSIAAAVYNQEDTSLFAGVLGFWFLDRHYFKR